MRTLSFLLGYSSGQTLPEEEDGPTRRVQLGVIAALLALAFAAIYGLAAGSSQWQLAVSNLVKLPVVVLLSSLFALPAGFLAWRLSNAPVRASDLLLSFATSVFAGTLVLAVASPLVALYYHTSAWAGPVLGVGLVFAALLIGTGLFVRGVIARVKPSHRRRGVLAPVAVMVLMQVATLLQLVALASPILPEVTVFDGGIDHMVR